MKRLFECGCGRYKRLQPYTSKSIGWIKDRPNRFIHGHYRKKARNFWERITKTESCWLWNDAKNTDGYGNIGINGKIMKAHRIAWEKTFGSIPYGLFVLHKCDNP